MVACCLAFCAVCHMLGWLLFTPAAAGDGPQLGPLLAGRLAALAAMRQWRRSSIGESPEVTDTARAVTAGAAGGSMAASSHAGVAVRASSAAGSSSRS